MNRLARSLSGVARTRRDESWSYSPSWQYGPVVMGPCVRRGDDS